MVIGIEGGSHPVGGRGYGRGGDGRGWGIEGEGGVGRVECG